MARKSSLKRGGVTNQHGRSCSSVAPFVQQNRIPTSDNPWFALTWASPEQRRDYIVAWVAQVGRRHNLEVMHERIVARLNDPTLRFTDLLDLYGELLTRLERYGF